MMAKTEKPWAIRIKIRLQRNSFNSFNSLDSWFVKPNTQHPKPKTLKAFIA